MLKKAQISVNSRHTCKTLYKTINLLQKCIQNVPFTFTEYDRILFIDATKYFKKGANKIEVVAESYRGSKGAGINFIAEITTTNGSFEIISDDKWKKQRS